VNEAKAARYQRLRRRADVISAAAGIVVLALCGFTPVGRALGDWAVGMVASVAAPWHSLAEVVVFVAVLAAALEVIALPAVIYLGVSLDRRFKRAERSLGGLVSAQLHAGVVGVVSAVIISLVVHVAVRVSGGWWWLLTGLVLSAALAMAVRGVSSLIARSDTAAALQSSALSARLAQVSVDAGVPVAGMFEWRDHGNEAQTASVTGFGRGRRVLIAPDVLRDWSEDEIAVVVAHELSHHKHHDLIQALMLDALLLSSALAVADFSLRLLSVTPGALMSLPMIALVAGAVWIGVTPARHGLSRWQERRADQFALAVTGEREAFAAAVRRLSAQHLAEERPSPMIRWLFHRHPTVDERLAMAMSPGSRVLSPESSPGSFSPGFGPESGPESSVQSGVPGQGAKGKDN
jgi:STE24 endopeptidase